MGRLPRERVDRARALGDLLGVGEDEGDEALDGLVGRVAVGARAQVVVGEDGEEHVDEHQVDRQHEAEAEEDGEERVGVQQRLDVDVAEEETEERDHTVRDAAVVVDVVAEGEEEGARVREHHREEDDQEEADLHRRVPERLDDRVDLREGREELEDLEVDEERVDRHQVVLERREVGDLREVVVDQRVVRRRLLERAELLADHVAAAEDRPEDADVGPVDGVTRQLEVGEEALAVGRERAAHLPELLQHEVAHEQNREDVGGAAAGAVEALVARGAVRPHEDEAEDAAALEPLEDEARGHQHVDVGVGERELDRDGARLQVEEAVEVDLVEDRLGVDALRGDVDDVPRRRVVAQQRPAVARLDLEGGAGGRVVPVHAARAVAVEVGAVDGRGAHRALRDGGEAARRVRGAPVGVGEAREQRVGRARVGRDAHLPQPHRAEHLRLVVDVPVEGARRDGVVHHGGQQHAAQVLRHLVHRAHVVEHLGDGRRRDGELALGQPLAHRLLEGVRVRRVARAEHHGREARGERQVQQHLAVRREGAVARVGLLGLALVRRLPLRRLLRLPERVLAHGRPLLATRLRVPPLLQPEQRLRARARAGALLAHLLEALPRLELPVGEPAHQARLVSLLRLVRRLLVGGKLRAPELAAPHRHARHPPQPALLLYQAEEVAAAALLGGARAAAHREQLARGGLLALAVGDRRRHRRLALGPRELRHAPGPVQ